MIKQFLAWFKAIYYTPVTTTETTKDIQVSKLALVSIITSQLANLLAANTVQITATDDAGVALVGATLTLATDNGASVTPTATTDANGQFTASIISSTVGASTLTATLDDGTNGSIQVYFVTVPAVVDPASEVVAAVSTVSALAEFKAKAEAEVAAFVAFVEHGIEVLGADAEAELVALKDKYL